MNNKKNKIYTNVLLGSLVLYFCWISFYGASILIIHHGNNFQLANPDTPIWLKVIDELILLFILFLLGLLYKLKIAYKKLGINFYLIIFPLCLLSFFQFLSYIYTTDFKYLLLCKNSISAILVTWILFSINNLNLLKKVIKFLLFILSLSISVGLLHYLIFPYQVYGDRLIGTYANPNVLGYVCFFGIALGHYSWDRGNNNAKFAIGIFAIGASASGSLSSLLVILLYLTLNLIFLSIQKFNSQRTKVNMRIITSTILIFIFGGLLNHIFIQNNLIKDLNYKITNIFSAITGNSIVDADTVIKRLDLLSNFNHESPRALDFVLPYFQSDSSLYNLFKNYPLIFFYIFVFSFSLSLCYKFLLKKEHLARLSGNPMIYFIFFSVFPFSFVQYVLEEIPSIILFYFAYTLLVIDFYSIKEIKKL